MLVSSATLVTPHGNYGLLRNFYPPYCESAGLISPFIGNEHIGLILNVNRTEEAVGSSPTRSILYLIWTEGWVVLSLG